LLVPDAGEHGPNLLVVGMVASDRDAGAAAGGHLPGGVVDGSRPGSIVAR
jgi:hypothetical protein